jgi:hypothetical protein
MIAMAAVSAATTTAAAVAAADAAAATAANCHHRRCRHRCHRLSQVMTWCVEVHTSAGALQASMMLKLTVARSINSAVLLYFASPYEDIMGSEDMLTQVTATATARQAKFGKFCSAFLYHALEPCTRAGGRVCAPVCVRICCAGQRLWRALGGVRCAVAACATASVMTHGHSRLRVSGGPCRMPRSPKALATPLCWFCSSAPWHLQAHLLS